MTYQQQHDAELERLTGICMIDSVQAGFDAAGIYLITPLSGVDPVSFFHTSYSRQTE